MDITSRGVVNLKNGKLLTTKDEIKEAFELSDDEASDVLREYLDAKSAAEAVPAGEAAPAPASASAPAAEAGEESLEQVVKINDIINLIDKKFRELKLEIKDLS